MAKYSKRADGRYCTSITVTLDGEKKKKTVYGKTVREVDDKIAELRSSSNKGVVVDDRSTTLAELARRWLSRKEIEVEANTYAGYENCVNVHIVPKIGDTRLKDLKKHHLQDLLTSLMAQGKRATAQKVRVTLGQLIDEAVENEYIFKDIAKTLSIPRAQKTKKRALTDEEVALLSVAQLPLKQRVFIDTIQCTGIRRGEALALTPDDVDTVNKKITINKTVVFKKNQSFIKPRTKSDEGMRTLPIPDKLNEELKELISDAPEYLFSQQNGKQMTRSGFRRFWEQIEKNIEKSTGQALPKDVTPHIFRHTYATKLFSAGVDVKTAQYLLGHASVKVTLEIYTHLEKQNVDKFAQVIDKLF